MKTTFNSRIHVFILIMLYSAHTSMYAGWFSWFSQTNQNPVVSSVDIVVDRPTAAQNLEEARQILLRAAHQRTIAVNMNYIIKEYPKLKGFLREMHENQAVLQEQCDSLNTQMQQMQSQFTRVVERTRYLEQLLEDQRIAQEAINASQPVAEATPDHSTQAHSERQSQQKPLPERPASVPLQPRPSQPKSSQKPQEKTKRYSSQSAHTQQRTQHVIFAAAMHVGNTSLPQQQTFHASHAGYIPTAPRGRSRSLSHG